MREAILLETQRKLTVSSLRLEERSRLAIRITLLRFNESKDGALMGPKEDWRLAHFFALLLDWLHISMRLRPIEQMATKVAATLDAVTGHGGVRTIEAAECSPPDVERPVASCDRALEDNLSGCV